MITIPTLQENAESVKTLTGLPYNVFEQLVNDARERYEEYEFERLNKRENRQRKVGGGQKVKSDLSIRILGVLMYLRLYTTQRVVALMTGLSQRRLSQDLRCIVPLIEELLPCPEIWEEISEHSREEFEVVELEGAFSHVIVDGVEQKINRPQDQDTQKKYYSGKKKMHTLKSQIVVTSEHEIKAISVPVPGRIHDKKLYEDLETTQRLPDLTLCSTDKAYIGIDTNIPTLKLKTPEFSIESPRIIFGIPEKKLKGMELSQEQKEFNKKVSKVRIRVEHCIGWMKNWKILSERFRCSHELYSSIMQVIGGMVNLQTYRWKEVKAGY